MNAVLNLVLNENLWPRIQKSNLVLNLVLNVNLRPQIQKSNVILNLVLNLTRAPNGLFGENFILGEIPAGWQFCPEQNIHLFSSENLRKKIG